MKIFLKKNVLEAARERISWLFDEFEDVVVSVSGGKDSTVVYHLCLEEAKRRNRLPLKVMWVDQEAEWTSTVEWVREVMYAETTQPYWYQIPLKIENSTSFKDVYQLCWDQSVEEHIHPYDPISIKDNTYDCPAWTDGIFDAIAKKDFDRVCFVAGVRAEESPARLMGLTGHGTYKGETWGKILSKEREQFTMYPIYDWSYTDVWRAIHEFKWAYNKIYDYQYMKGIKIQSMRVSNLHHETAVEALFYLQEFDGNLYNALTKRMDGIDTANKMQKENFMPKELPFMFASWTDYRHYLTEKLIPDNEYLKKLVERTGNDYAKVFEGDSKMLIKGEKILVATIILGDVAGTKINNFKSAVLTFYKRDKKRKAEKDEI